MKNILSSIWGIFLTVLLIGVLYQVGKNKESGKPSNVVKETGRVTKQIFTDLKDGWNSFDETLSDTTQFRDTI